jgi:general secretion pathway protein D
MWGMVVPNVTLSLVRQAGEAETLAQPQLRVTEGEKGKLVIGDRVPIPTTTFNTGSTIGGNIVPVTAFQYQDVGITIDVEPRVHHNNEVTMKLSVEVSELGENVQIAVGQEQPKIGTRTITSVIRLKDGETSLLAGLFKYNKREGGSGVPFLADIPVIGALFRSNSVDMKKTDLVLTLTPHIIRNPDITMQDLEPLWVGTENRVTIFGNSPRVQSAAPVGPFGSQAVSPPNMFGEGAGEPPPEEPPAEEPAEETPAQVEPRRITIPAPPPTPTPNPGDSVEMQQSSLSSVEVGDGGLRLTRVAFYPSRLPIALGQEGSLLVVLEVGSSPAAGPLHLAYDASRLEVVKVEEGDLPVGGRNARVAVTHTPALGWLTASWSGAATGSGTLMKLVVRPRQAGELPLVFAGPVGEAVAEPATVVAVPAAVNLVGSGETK